MHKKRKKLHDPNPNNENCDHCVTFLIYFPYETLLLHIMHLSLQNGIMSTYFFSCMFLIFLLQYIMNHNISTPLNILLEHDFSWLHEMHHNLLTNSLFFDTEIVPDFLV